MLLVAAVLTSACTGNLTCVHDKLVIFEQKMEQCVILEAYNLKAHNSVAMRGFWGKPTKI